MKLAPFYSNGLNQNNNIFTKQYKNAAQRKINLISKDTLSFGMAKIPASTMENEKYDIKNIENAKLVLESAKSKKDLEKLFLQQDFTKETILSTAIKEANYETIEYLLDCAEDLSPDLLKNIIMNPAGKHSDNALALAAIKEKGLEDKKP